MKRYIQGKHRGQGALLPERLDDYVANTTPVRMVDIFVDELDLGQLGFNGVVQVETGQPNYHPVVPLKIYVYGYLNRIQSSRRIERESRSRFGLQRSRYQAVVPSEYPCISIFLRPHSRQ
nr:transposase [Stutzerimonas kunmingensis]